MPIISTDKELLAAWGQVIDATNPIDELKARGYTLSPKLAAALDTAAARALFAGAERQRLLTERRERRRAATVQAGPLPRFPVPPALPGGHHDLTVGLKFEKVNEILLDAFLKRSIPRDVSLAGRVSDDSLAQLLAILRNELIGVPPGSEIQIGKLHITGAPTMSALATPPPPPNSPVDSTARVLVHLPIALDLDRVPADGPRQSAVTALRAVANFGLAVTAAVAGTELAISLGPVPRQIGINDPERLRLTITTDSPLRPATPNSGDNIGFAIELGDFQKVLRGLAIATTIAPRVKLPLGSGLQVFVRHIDLRAVPAVAPAPGHLMVGLEIGAEQIPPITGQPELLERNPFDNSGSSVYVEANAELFRVLVKQALASGELLALAKKRASNVELHGADAELGDNTIGVFLDGTLVDECGVFGEDFKDVDFDGWTRVALRGVDGGHIKYEEVESLGIGDADPVDVAVCVALSFLDLKILSIGRALLEAFFNKLSSWIFGESSATDSVVNLFDPNFPIPLTELLPRLRALNASIDTTALRIQVALDLVPDTINTYVYVRTEFHMLPHIPGPGVPVSGVQVRLFDQDVPPPPQDDAPVPEVGETDTVVKDRLISKSVTFDPSPSDQQLASGTTDSQGRVQLVISPGRVQTSAGVETIITVTEDLPTGKIISSDVKRITIREPKPDVYLLLDVPGGGRVDTRTAPGGFVRNLNTKRWGTATEPLVFNVPMPSGGIEIG